MSASGGGEPFSADVPACAECVPRLATGQRLRLLVATGLSAIVVAVALALLQGRRQGVERGGVLIAFGTLAILPWVFMDSVLPPPFSMTLAGASVAYTFRNADVAAAFASVNGRT